MYWDMLRPDLKSPSTRHVEMRPHRNARLLGRIGAFDYWLLRPRVAALAASYRLTPQLSHATITDASAQQAQNAVMNLLRDGCSVSSRAASRSY